MSLRFGAMAGRFFGCLLAVGLWGDLAAQPAWAAPDISNLRPMKGIAYEPAPSDDTQLQVPPFNQFNAVYYDTDFYNSDFAALWGPDGGGRNDLLTMKNAGINFLHIYNWNPGRNHTPFLDAVKASGMKVMIPISNYTNCLIVGNCQGVNVGSYQNAFTNIQNIFNQIYPGSSTTAHPAAAMWGIYNEYDKNTVDPVNVAFVVQALIKLENDRGVPAANRLPITVPVSFATRTAAEFAKFGQQQPPFFQAAEQLYKQIKPALDVPGGVLAQIALYTAFERAQQQGTTSYGGVPVAAMPADFWTTRYLASVNPFETGLVNKEYITDANQFQSAFPGTTAWNALPPLFYTEMGINIGGANPQTTDGQAAWVLGQIRCTHPLALNPASTTQGYFFGSNIFMLPNEAIQGSWGLFVFAGPNDFVTRKTTSGQDYRQDTLKQQPVWNSVITGYQTTQLQCP